MPQPPGWPMAGPLFVVHSSTDPGAVGAGKAWNDGTNPLKIRDATNTVWHSSVNSTASKQTVTGAKGGNAALTSLIAALVAAGVPITDNTS